MSKNTEVGRRLAYLQKEKGSYIIFLYRCGFDSGLKKNKKQKTKAFTQRTNSTDNLIKFAILS